MTTLVTGGAGYIGSHQLVALAAAGEPCVVVDDGSNSDVQHVLAHVAELTGASVPFHRFDVRDTNRLAAVMRRHRVRSVIHFAAMKDLRESVSRPLDYHDGNVGGLLSLLRACETTGVREVVFSSSGSVYGNATQLPITETTTLAPTNPYAETKAIGERMLADLCAADSSWAVTALRYFNPAGAHPSGLLGERPTRRRSNLMPLLLDVATGDRPFVEVFGDDYDTPDGTGVRDYVHVMDVVEAHVAALHRLRSVSGFEALNVGRGDGVSVMELIAAVEATTGRPVPFVVRDRRPGDVAALVGSTDRLTRVLGVRADRCLAEIASDAWRWHQLATDPSSCWAIQQSACRRAV